MNFEQTFFNELEKIAKVHWHVSTDRGDVRASNQRYGFFTGKRKGGPRPQYKARRIKRLVSKKSGWTTLDDLEAQSRTRLDDVMDRAAHHLLMKRWIDEIESGRPSPPGSRIDSLLAMGHRRAHLSAGGFGGKPPVLTREWPLSLKERIKHRLMGEKKRQDKIKFYDNAMGALLKGRNTLRDVKVLSGK